MTRKKLRQVLEPSPGTEASLRWRAAVPIATNPFLLLEFFQFAFVGGLGILVTLCVGVWLMDGALSAADLRMALAVFGATMLALSAGFVALGLFCFGNRYFAVFQMDQTGIYYEGSRGRDETRGLFHFSTKPLPVCGQVQAKRTSGRHLPWSRVNRFENFPARRVIILRRGFWHMLKLYTPDPETHARVIQRLEERLGRA